MHTRYKPRGPCLFTFRPPIVPMYIYYQLCTDDYASTSLLVHYINHYSIYYVLLCKMSGILANALRIPIELKKLMNLIDKLRVTPLECTHKANIGYYPNIMTTFPQCAN